MIWCQVAHYVHRFLLLYGGSQDHGVAKLTLVQSVLCLHSLLTIAVLNQSDPNPRGEIQVEVVKGPVLHAQGAECGPVCLGSQVLQQKPS